MQNIDLAYDNIVEAYSHNKSDSRIIENYKTILFARETGIYYPTVF